MSYASGGVAGPIVPDWTLPTGWTYANVERFGTVTITTATVAGTLYMTAIGLPAGVAVTNLGWSVGSTSLVNGTGPHYWVALFDINRNLLRQSTDDTAPVVTLNLVKSTALSSPFTTTYSGLHYVGVMVQSGASVAGTQPTFATVPTSTAAVGAGGAPKLTGTADTGLTTTAPSTAAAISSTNVVWIVYAS